MEAVGGRHELLEVHDTGLNEFMTRMKGIWKNIHDRQKAYLRKSKTKMPQD